MVTMAPNWTIDAGWEYINSTNVSLVKAAVAGLKESAGASSNFYGYAYLLGLLTLFFIVGFLLWQRTQKMYVAVSGTIILCVLLTHFGMMENIYLFWISGIGCLLIAIEWIYWMMNKD